MKIKSTKHPSSNELLVLCERMVIFMMCKNCGERPANVYFTKIINGIAEEYALCGECSKALGINAVHSVNINLGNMLNEMLSKGFITQNSEIQGCETCGTSHNDFSKEGRFGCPDCYSFFSPHITGLMNKLHGHSAHTGKIPKRCGKKLLALKEMKELKEKMDAAVREQNFEEAARLRDEIKLFEKEEI